MITQSYTLSLQSVGPPVRVSCCQGDTKSRDLSFKLVSDGVLFAPPTGATVTIDGTKPDGKAFTVSGTLSGSTATVTLTEQMTVLAGEIPCQLTIISGTEVLGTARFLLCVQPSAISDDPDLSETDLSAIADLRDTAIAAKTAAAASASEAAASASSASASASAAATTLASAVKVTDFTDANLTWNANKVTTAQLPPVIKALSGCPNLLEFIPAAAVTIEYTRDGGATWTDYGASDSEKVGLFDVLYTGDLYLGKRATSDTSSTSDGLRITIDADTAGVYAMVRYLVVYVNQTCKFTLETATRNAPTLFTAKYSGVNAYSFTAIPMNQLLFGNFNVQNHDTHLRLTLLNGSSGVAYIEHLWMFASQAWRYPSNLARCGHLYKWDLDQNATFPGNITANKLIGDLTGAATSLVDSGDTTKTIKIGYRGDGLTADTATCLAGFNADGNMKNVPWTVAKGKIQTYTEGTSGNWKFRKWESGFKEAWYRGPLTTSIEADGGGGIYFKSGLSVDYPFAYDSAPMVNISVTAPGVMVWPVVAAETDTSSVYFYLVSNSSKTSQTYYVNLYIAG